MYATDLRDQLFAAALPLKPLVVWCGSACSVTVAVPPAPAIEGLAISSVSIELSLPSGEVISAPAVQTAGTPLWTATFAAGNFATAGSTTQGFTVYLGGKDETGADRVWIVAKGDLEIRAGDAAPSPGGSYYIVKLRDSAPANPVAGDAYISGGKLHIYSGTAWTTIGAEPSDDDPLMDGEASAGESEQFARGDHVHPSDTSKLDGAAAYPAWDAETVYSTDDVVSHNGSLWIAIGTSLDDEPSGDAQNWSQTNINSLKQDALTEAQLAAANSGATAAKVATWDGYAAQIASKANAADLPYAIAVAQQTGDWQFNGDGVLSEHTYSVVTEPGTTSGTWDHSLFSGGVVIDGVTDDIENPVYIVFAYADITAIRAYALQDRTNNKVPLAADSGTAYLQLPPAVPGKMRDLLVRVKLATGYMAATNPSNSFDFVAPSTGETVSYEPKGGEMPYPEEDGTYWFSLSESDQTIVGGVVTACKFAVSMEKLEEVS